MLSILGKNFSTQHFGMFHFFGRHGIWQFMQIVYFNLHEMSAPIFPEKKKKKEEKKKKNQSTESPERWASSSQFFSRSSAFAKEPTFDAWFIKMGFFFFPAKCLVLLRELNHMEDIGTLPQRSSLPFVFLAGKERDKLILLLPPCKWIHFLWCFQSSTADRTSWNLHFG